MSLASTYNNIVVIVFLHVAYMYIDIDSASHNMLLFAMYFQILLTTTKLKNGHIEIEIAAK